MAPTSEPGLIAALLLVGCGVADEPVAAVPTEPLALHAWLSEEQYETWSPDSSVQPGLNGSGRRVYLSPDVDPAGSPVGAAAVREIYVRDSERWERVGWSALVKVSDEGEPLDNWAFFETFDLEDPDAFAVAGPNAPGCAACHASAADVIRSR